MAVTGRGRTVVELSSLPLQITLHLNVWYSIVFCIGELLLYIFKGSILPYPNMGGTLAMEIILIFILAFIEGVRLFFGYKGNLAERTMAILISIILCIPVLFIDLYLLIWQTYVLKLEVILCAIALVFLGLEVILSIAVVFTFKRNAEFFAAKEIEVVDVTKTFKQRASIDPYTDSIEENTDIVKSQ